MTKNAILLALGCAFLFGLCRMPLLASEQTMVPTKSIVLTQEEYLNLMKESGRLDEVQTGFLNGIIIEFDWNNKKVRLTWWKLFGSLAALLFAGRWLVQMYYSRKEGRPVIPRMYWFISVFASLMLLCYWLFSPKSDMVGVLQNLFPFFVAIYNLLLDFRYHQSVKKREVSETPEPMVAAS